MYFESVERMVGGTPAVEIKRYCAAAGAGARIIAKLEGFNPAGSVKDRVALHMIAEAERKGLLKAGSTIVEPTSGNTGIGLAAFGTARGYKVVLTMPDTMSAERIKLIRAYGAEVVLTPGAEGMAGAVRRAEEIAARSHGIVAGQFTNPANPEAHYLTTGPEIWADCGGNIDCFVAGVGTGGTISGAGRYLKERKPAVRIVAVEPASSPLLSKGYAGPHGLQGIGANFVPDTLDKNIYDEVAAVGEEEAYAAARLLAKSEGLLCGISSGAALHAATLVARRAEFAGKTIVVLLPDGGEKYLSTPLFG